MNGSLQAIVFDFDGVIADSEPLHLRAFQQALGITHALGAEMVLFHLDVPIEAPFSYTDVTIGISEAFIEDAERAAQAHNRRAARRWLAEASKAGVRCTLAKGARGYQIAPEILKSARRYRADLICLAGYRRPRTLAPLGGNMRDLLSQAKTPVLELHAA